MRVPHPDVDVPFFDVAAAQAEADPAIRAALGRVLDSGWFVLGPEVEAFEAAWAAYCEAAHAVGVGNGLEALRLVLEASGIGAGDEVIVPGQTFIATWLACSAVGAIPVAVDVDPTTGLLRPDAVEAAVTTRTAAIMAVHLFGQPADLRALTVVAQRHGLALFEDAAQAHGARHHGRRVGAVGTASGFSFYPGKNLGALGDGGAVVTDDAALAGKVRRLRNYGSTVKYHHDVVGTNSRLDELQAAVLSAKLPFLDGWNKRRATVAARYHQAFECAGSVQTPRQCPGNESSWHLYVISTDDRDALAAELARRGVATGVHYPCTPARSGAYAATHAACDLPGADTLARRCLSLPLSPVMDDDAVDTVVTAVRAARS